MRGFFFAFSGFLAQKVRFRSGGISLYPSKYPLQIFFCKGYAATTSTALFHPLNILLHPVRAIPLHLVGDVAVYVQRKRRRSVSEISLYRLNAVPSRGGDNSERMPL